MQTIERKPAQAPRKARTGLFLLMGVVVVALIGAAVWLINRDGEETPTDVIQDVATAMRTDDSALFEEAFGGTDLWFLERQVAMKAEPAFDNCTETGNRVSCDVTYGPDFFYARVSGEQSTSRIGGFINDDGKFVGTSWPPPAGLRTVEPDFASFIAEVHPEQADDLSGTPGYLGYKMNRETGEIRMQLLNEFKTWLG